jgi:regulator of protease activity HflC (stomatin/prohibitin superfamily)
MTLTILVFAPFTIAVLSPFLARKLAELEKFWATCQEGQARPVTMNKKFHKFIMSFAGKCFAGELDPSIVESSEEYWEVVDDERPKKKGLFGKVFKGLHFIGVPPFAEIQRYKMTWIEWGYPKKSDGTVSVDKAPIPHEEIISHVLVQSDVYFVRVPSAETSEGVPVDINFLLTIRVTNPYKALYRVQHWLEAVTNQTEGTTRVFIGTKKSTELFTLEEDTDKRAVGKVVLSPTSSEVLLEALKERFREFKESYGVQVELPQIQSVEPAGSDAKKYRELMTMEYEAEQNAKRVMIEAGAEAGRISTVAKAQKTAVEDVIGAVAQIPGGAEIFHSQQIGGLKNLSTYVEGRRGKKDTGTVISIPTDPGKK